MAQGKQLDTCTLLDTRQDVGTGATTAGADSAAAPTKGSDLRSPCGTPQGKGNGGAAGESRSCGGSVSSVPNCVAVMSPGAATADISPGTPARAAPGPLQGSPLGLAGNKTAPSPSPEQLSISKPAGKKKVWLAESSKAFLKWSKYKFVQLFLYFWNRGALPRHTSSNCHTYTSVVQEFQALQSLFCLGILIAHLHRDRRLIKSLNLVREPMFFVTS